MTSTDEARLRGYVVFSQRQETRVELAAWDAHAKRFFDARIDLGAEGRSLVVTAKGQAAAERLVVGRLREPEDMALAEAAETAQGGGLGLLARRCPVVWLVERAADRDPAALLLAAILAGVLLGPILDARVPELLGVKTARARLAAA